MKLTNPGCFLYWGFLRFRGHDFKLWGHIFLVVWPCGAIPPSIRHDLCHFPLLALTSKKSKHTIPKEPSRCNEFVEILEIFPHQCDIYCFHAGREPLVTLCLNLQKFGMFWLCLKCIIYFCMMFKPTKNRYFLYVFTYIYRFLSSNFIQRLVLLLLTFSTPCF
jgi:hypothetical protein